MIPASILSANARLWLSAPSGFTNEAARLASIEQAEVSLERKRRMMRAAPRKQAQTIQRQIDAIEAAISEAEQLGGANYIGSVYGVDPADPDAPRGDLRELDFDLHPCVYPSCNEVITRDEQYLQAGRCARCYALALGRPDPTQAWRTAPASTERKHHE